MFGERPGGPRTCVPMARHGRPCSVAGIGDRLAGSLGRTYGFAGKPAPFGSCCVAIYSLHHSPIGKSTQAQAYTAAAHIKYITRARALTRVVGARMPTAAVDAMRFLRQAEDGDRKNARIIDKIMLALPRELNDRQRVELVRAYAEAITEGRASWLAAFHENGKDAQNPHCHLVIRDRDHYTGKRVFGMSENGSTERLRVLWERCANRALEQAKAKDRIDHRTLKEQGIAREPTIHEGVRGRRMHRERRKVSSRKRTRRNAIGARSRTRLVNYPAIDKGRSRSAYNEALRGRAKEVESDYWQALDADTQRREFEQLRAIHKPPESAADVQRERLRAYVRTAKLLTPRRYGRGREDEHEPD